MEEGLTISANRAREWRVSNAGWDEYKRLIVQVVEAHINARWERISRYLQQRHDSATLHLEFLYLRRARDTIGVREREAWATERRAWSSRTRPWILNDRGQLVLSDATNIKTPGASTTKKLPRPDAGTLDISPKLELSVDAMRDEPAEKPSLVVLAVSAAPLPDAATSGPVGSPRDADNIAPTDASADTADTETRRRTLLGRHTIGGRSFIEWLPMIGRDSLDGLTYIEQHAAALAWSSQRATILRKARQRTNMMHAGTAGPYSRNEPLHQEKDENVAPPRNYQLRARHSSGGS
ncbi:hypothetical protein B0H16DRAFT_1454367 [Mycena metata]|uniref:Uncharacterized protein n=1 Tax=Mycena metata TaxID=1033252 RepID=A0AAD7JIH9_9AGAR|nr:hypothetical protein B0H16DRAFT_1454367 [Mycena metata]